MRRILQEYMRLDRNPLLQPTLSFTTINWRFNKPKVVLLHRGGTRAHPTMEPFPQGFHVHFQQSVHVVNSSILFSG